jgi:hypothetical protein
MSPDGKSEYGVSSSLHERAKSHERLIESFHLLQFCKYNILNIDTAFYVTWRRVSEEIVTSISMVEQYVLVRAIIFLSYFTTSHHSHRNRHVYWYENLTLWVFIELQHNLWYEPRHLNNRTGFLVNPLWHSWTEFSVFSGILLPVFEEMYYLFALHTTSLICLPPDSCSLLA